MREALKTLAGTGLVVMSQYKGVTVRMVDADMAREVYEVRLLLEPEALRRTVCRGAPLDAAHAALERAENATDAVERSRANRGRGYGALYTEQIRQADTGCDFAFLAGPGQVPDPYAG